MSRVSRTAFFLAGLNILICIGPLPSLARRAESLSGDWIGRLDSSAGPGLLRITVGGTAREGWTATVVLQPINAISPNNAEARRVLDTWQNARVTVTEPSWSVAAGIDPNMMRLEVRTTHDASRATVRFRGETAQIALQHLASVDRLRERQRAGTYVLPTSERIHIWRPSSAGPIVGGLRRADGYLTYLEEATGRSGILYPVASDTYIAGPTSMLPDPVRIRAVFREGANGADQIVWQRTGRNEMVAARSRAYRREDIQLAGPGGVLGCDVLLPARAGKHPAAVLVPGAGAHDRYELYMMAEVFAEHGVAALSCDKRGTGASEGDWRLTSFEQQAQDVAAGVHFLQQRTDIDARRVGVFGLSEGAWVAPIAVAGNPRVAFLILAAAPATSRRQSVLMANADRLRREGASAADVARYREFFDRYQQAIIDNDAVAIEQLWGRYAGAAWLPPNMPTRQTLTDWSWQRARLTWSYEPRPVLSRISCPVLAIWGAEDTEFPPTVNGPLIEQAMLAARNSHYTLRTIPGADHSFRQVAPSFIELIGYAPEYFRAVLQWLTSRIGK